MGFSRLSDRIAHSPTDSEMAAGLLTVVMQRGLHKGIVEEVARACDFENFMLADAYWLGTDLAIELWGCELGRPIPAQPIVDAVVAECHRRYKEKNRDFLTRPLAERVQWCKDYLGQYPELRQWMSQHIDIE